MQSVARLLRLSGLWFGILWLISGCATAPPVIKIGLVAPFEGAERAVGYDVIYAARLAVREINESGGIGPRGTRVALVALDDGGQPAAARQTAQALIRDPAIVAVIGHGLPLTTEAAAADYRAAGMPFVPLSLPPFAPFAADQLPADFVARYEAVTPFDEQPGPLAGPTYDALQLIFVALRGNGQSRESLSREVVANYLPKSTHQGITGTVSLADEG